MKYLQNSIKAVIQHGEESGYIASCFDLPVVTQGQTLDDTVANLHEALELHFEDEESSELGYIK